MAAEPGAAGASAMMVGAEEELRSFFRRVMADTAESSAGPKPSSTGLEEAAAKVVAGRLQSRGGQKQPLRGALAIRPVFRRGGGGGGGGGGGEGRGGAGAGGGVSGVALTGGGRSPGRYIPLPPGLLQRAHPPQHVLAQVAPFREGQTLGEAPSQQPAPVRNTRTGEVLLQGWGLPSNRSSTTPGQTAADLPSVLLHDRKVRLTSEMDRTSLYALCRRWLHNDVPRGRQEMARCLGGVTDSWPIPGGFLMLPPPPPAEEGGEVVGTEAEVSSPTGCAPTLEAHMQHFAQIRKRCQAKRIRRIVRYRYRLQMLLPSPRLEIAFQDGSHAAP